MDFGLRGRAAIVMGSSSGMGRAVAQLLAHEGASLTLFARRAELLDELAEELAPASVRIQVLTGDATAPGAIERMVEDAAAFHGHLDVLVHNVGGPPPGTALGLDADAVRKALDLTLLTATRAARAAVPHMSRERFGRIVSIESTSIREPIANLVLSNTLRPAVAGYFKTLAAEVGPLGITVNCVCPGYTRTERLSDLARRTAEREGKPSEEVEAEWARATAVGRIATPEEVAAAVVFLCSEQAASITGTLLPVDGGSLRGT
jgi:3-oxoacyl-[acyl-carrier protein] reductase